MSLFQSKRLIICTFLKKNQNTDAPWCGHCKALVPEYSKAASALKGIVRVGAVNADEHQSLGAQYNIKGKSIKLTQ